MSVGIVATLLMATISRGDWMYAAAVFMIANIGIAASFVFYDSLLPHIAAPDEMDRVSTAAYAIGYLGGGVLLVVNLAWILAPDSVRARRFRRGHPAVVRQRRCVVAGLLAAVVLSRPRTSAEARTGREPAGQLDSALRSFACGTPSTSCAAIVRRS